MAEKKEKKGELVPREYLSPSAVMREFDRMFDDFRGEFEDRFWRPLNIRRPSVEVRMPFMEMPREPLVDLADLGDRFELTAEMPGIPKDKINIHVSDDSIEVRAEVEEEVEEKEKEYCCRERTYTGFYRKMALPAEVVSGKADARMTDGMLKITLPKKKPEQMPKMRKLKVK
jgi:HSP20 family protein